jgi:exodeoxyribonuclease VII large subunit
VSKWTALKRELNEQGIVLRPGTVVSISGYADLYAPQGKVGFTVVSISVQDLLGDMAKRRQELITRLTAEGVIGDEARNKSLATPLAPLRVGLVASEGTEGYADFTGQLLSSGFSFRIVHVKTLVQGEEAPPQIVAAIAALDHEGLDVICVVRGGGSKGDLACFDDERVARAIAAAATPIWTGIGHTGDVSIADLAAHTFAITPTKLGETVVTQVAQYYERAVRQNAQRMAAAVEARVDQATEFLKERRRTMTFAVRDRLTSEERHVRGIAQRLISQGQRVVTSATSGIAAKRQLLSAYDPQRRLAQGWAVVTTSSGDIVRSVDDVAEGIALRIRVRDGQLGATVTSKERSEP